MEVLVNHKLFANMPWRKCCFNSMCKSQKMKVRNGKSSGPGGISVELIKYGGDRLKEKIRNLIDRVSIL